MAIQNPYIQSVKAILLSYILLLSCVAIQLQTIKQILQLLLWKDLYTNIEGHVHTELHIFEVKFHYVHTQ